MIFQFSNSRFTKQNFNSVFETIVSTDEELRKIFNDYTKEEYQDTTDERLYHIDITEISRYIIDKLKNKQTENFDSFFTAVELILSDCDDEVENLIVIGLFEGIQNLGGGQIDYYTGFNQWLKPLSATKWRALIDFWEGKEWRKSKYKGDRK